MSAASVAQTLKKQKQKPYNKRRVSLLLSGKQIFLAINKRLMVQVT